jgi:hypothetical protein
MQKNRFLGVPGGYPKMGPFSGVPEGAQKWAKNRVFSKETRRFLRDVVYDISMVFLVIIFIVRYKTRKATTLGRHDVPRGGGRRPGPKGPLGHVVLT